MGFINLVGGNCSLSIITTYKMQKNKTKTPPKNQKQPKKTTTNKISEDASSSYMIQES